ncbi:sensor histidine kinase [Halalkalibacter okhensis]|uniref:sensor histidine kinase n=1 Tax=Halalkalibacter okhensis TaxID=333138 RepID=UPI000A42F4A5|nr:ATP-binding protein [Halalkalibacter okhensis]
MPFKQIVKRMTKINLMLKLTVINSIVVGLVIWIVGVSVKDFACYLIEQENSLSAEQRLGFTNQLDSYLVYAVILSIFIAAVVHFYFIRSLLYPLSTLTEVTKEIAKGNDPVIIYNKNSDEIGQLSRHFNEMIRKIKKVEESREKMTQDVAHELRTPLTNINGYLEALRSGVINGNQELYDSLFEESKRLTSLVEQLQQLNVWKNEYGSSVNYECLSIRLLIESQVEIFRLELQKQSIQIKISIEDKQLYADKEGLKQVLTNLIENVLNYDKGGWMEIKGFMSEKGYQVQVKNEGLPIPVEDPNQPFERFYRADLSRNRNLGGSGLGLSIVKEIIKSHNGELGLKTSQNVHTFWFTLPIENDRKFSG